MSAGNTELDHSSNPVLSSGESAKFRFLRRATALSGAPLVLERPATALERALTAMPGVVPVIGPMLIDPRSIPRHALHLLGICVGTTEAETVTFAHSEVINGNITFSEKTSKVELYGLAHDLLPLADWRPGCLNGLTLREAIYPT